MSCGPTAVRLSTWVTHVATLFFLFLFSLFFQIPNPKQTRRCDKRGFIGRYVMFELAILGRSKRRGERGGFVEDHGRLQPGECLPCPPHVSQICTHLQFFQNEQPAFELKWTHRFPPFLFPSFGDWGAGAAAGAGLMKVGLYRAWSGQSLALCV